MKAKFSVIKRAGVLSAIALLAGSAGLIASISGAIYTTLGNGATVNQNVYPGKDTVYLNGGPQNENGSGLSNGNYYFQVTDPSGKILLSTDPIECRQLKVENSRISGAIGPCPHVNGDYNPVNLTTAVQLMPFSETPNAGGEYKVWLSASTDFKSNKTDNFKVQPPVPPQPPVKVLTVKTEVDVTGFAQVDPTGNTSIKIVGWDSGSYKAEHGIISTVTSQPGWSVTVQDRAFVSVNDAQPQGTVFFTLYNNDQCKIDEQAGLTGDPWGTSSSWTLVSPGLYKSGLSTPFTFNNGGAWSFGAKYIENPSSPDYGNVADLGCEAWSIPQVNTDIYAKGTPDTKVTGGSVLVGSGIYDTASVDTKSAAVIPGTSSIEFRRFKTANCTGDYTDASIGTGAVALNTGATTGTAKSIDSIVDARYLSYLAIFHSGNEGLVSSVADTTVYVQGGAPGCEPLTAIGKPLDVTKDVSAALDRLYKWKINKSVDSSLKEAANSSTFNYTVKVDQDGAPVDSNYTTSGTISVSNPNYWDVTGVAITDSIDNGGNCTLTGGSNVTIVAGAPASQFSYSCSYSGAPSKFSGTNTGTATYTDASINGGSQTATNGTAGYTFSMNATNKTIHVTDNLQGPLGTLTGTDAPAYASATYTYSRTQTPAAGKCTTENNTATITETGQNSSASATACNMKTGALTIGYWQNKNGQAIITGGASTSGVCNSGTFLRQFAPFQDLSPTANCNQVNTYVQGIIKSANASGTTMNAMLKAQMLATALDVYFSSPAGGSKIGNVSLGGVKINLTIIPTAPGASTTEDASPEFGGSPKTVLEILQAASANSNVGGTVWYGQNKPTQEFAKDTFDAINNEVAPIF